MLIHGKKTPSLKLLFFVQLACPKWWKLRVAFHRQLLSYPMDPNTVCVLESRHISMDGATQIPISEFEARRWYNSRVCVWYFQVCKFQSCLLAKYFILVNKWCSCSHINFGQTAWDTDPLLCLSFFTWAALKRLMDLNIAWELAFRACFPGTNRLVILRWFSNNIWIENRCFDFHCLSIGVEAYFWEWCKANPNFGIWSAAQLKSLCMVLSGL